jgi:hypothetical protein
VEVAFSVEARWRSRGIGSALMMDAFAMAQRLRVELAFLMRPQQPRHAAARRKKMRAEIHFEDGDCLAGIATPRLQVEVTRADAFHAAFQEPPAESPP